MPYRCSSVAAPDAPTPEAPGNLSEAAQSNEIWNLCRLDAIPRADLGRTNTRHLTSADGVKDGGTLRGKLKRVAISARNEDDATASFFSRASGGEKIVRLVARSFCILEAACRNEFRYEIELLNQSVVEFASTLISGKFLMPIVRGIERVPGDEHGTGLLFAVEAQQKVGKAKNGACRLAAAPQIVFGRAW